MEIHKIYTPVMGKAADGVMHHYARYFANKLEASLLGVHASQSKTVLAAKTSDLSIFSDFIRDCNACGIACETQLRPDSWQIVFNHADSADLVVFPFGQRLCFPDLTLEDGHFAPSRPVLCCPDHYIDIESIALAYDGSDSVKRALDLAVWLSEKAVWPLSVLMVVENQEQGVCWLDEVEAFLDTLTINSATIILPGPVEKALHRFMQEGSVELLIMGTVGKHCPATGLMGSTAASMLKVATYPLLMVS